MSLALGLSFASLAVSERCQFYATSMPMAASNRSTTSPLWSDPVPTDSKWRFGLGMKMKAVGLSLAITIFSTDTRDRRGVIGCGPPKWAGSCSYEGTLRRFTCHRRLQVHPGAPNRPFAVPPDRWGRDARVCVPIPTLGLKEGLFVSFQTDRSNPFSPTSIIENSHRLGRRKWNVPW